ncbi:U-box domain-containing protein 40 [Malania oleifera]|uniref:U-box domain-containing protein 40 n=1 Tax=Malania oleifera TaxID=397392 RepID=UPI0025AEC9FE|nr:U-box domain-containing protein 40 [Malania oleifera]
MGNGKHRWRISFYRTSSSNAGKLANKHHPEEFICPITGSLMADPVIVSSGHTFERASVQACKNLGFTPNLPGDSPPDFSTVIPNLALKSTIVNWCDKCVVERPKPLDYPAIEKLVRTLMASREGENHKNGGGEGEGEGEEGEGEGEGDAEVAENPGVKFTHAASDLICRPTHLHSSSDESIGTAVPTPPLQFATRPSCYSSSSSSSSLEMETLTVTPSSTPIGEEEIAAKLKSSQVFEQEEAVISLRKVTRSGEEARVSLCTHRLLSALRFLIISRYAIVQVNAIAALVNLSLEKANKVKIVRSGIVPHLIDVLRSASPEAQDHASGALFSLALDDNNKTAIGVLGALPPLLHALRSESERTRHDSALALYHLSLVQSNRVKLVKLGAAQTLLGMAGSGHMAGRVLLVLCNLAACADGRTAMLEGGAVECLVGMLRGEELDSESIRESCVAVLYGLSQGGLRFKVAAREAGAVEVLWKVEREGSERAKEKARRMLEMMKGKEKETEEEVDWEELLDLGLGLGLSSRTRSRLGSVLGGSSVNSTEF